MTQPKILIVDDELDVAKLAAKRLRAMGYDTMCFFHGKGAIETIHALKPDLLLLDILLPDMSGIDIYKQMKCDGEIQDIPTIFFSANATNEDYCLMELGADGFIKKPYDPIELNQMIQRALAKRPKHEANAL